MSDVETIPVPCPRCGVERQLQPRGRDYATRICRACADQVLTAKRRERAAESRVHGYIPIGTLLAVECRSCGRERRVRYSGPKDLTVTLNGTCRHCHSMSDEPDHAVVHRLMEGIPTKRTPAETREAVYRLTLAGLGVPAIAARIGSSTRTVERARAHNARTRPQGGPRTSDLKETA